MVFYLIASVQVGIGILSFQSEINKHAGHDAWMSVIIAGVCIHVMIWMMYSVLKGINGDLVDVHKRLFGRIAGAFFTIFFSFYLILGSTVVIRSYLEVVQVWMFPQMKIWSILLVILPLVFYIICGDFRVVVGVCFLGFVVPAFLTVTFLFPLQYSNMNLILPIFDHSIKDIWLSANEAVLGFIGISTLMIYYPFIKDKERSSKWAYLGNFTTTFIYLIVTLVTFMYYNQDQLSLIKWPTLDIWKIIELPFVARFEYMGVSTWFLVILPTLTLFLWAASRILYRQFHVSQHKLSVIFLIIIIIACVFLQTREDIEQITKVFSLLGRVVFYIYIPLLFLTYTILRMVKKI